MKFVDLRSAEDIAANPNLVDPSWFTEDPSIIEMPGATSATAAALRYAAPADASGLTSAAYSLGKARLTQDTDLSRAAASYADQIRRRNESQNRKQAAWSWDRNRDATAWAGASRGFGNGGAIQNDAWSTYSQGRKSAYDSMANQEQAGAYNNQQTQQDITRGYVRGNEDLELSEFDRKASLAASLRGIA